MKPYFSIIIMVYKVEKYLRRSMDTLVNQTLDGVEIICINDGSPDNCPKICDECAKKDGRIKVIHKKNGGVSDARNAGIKVATGKYISFVDSDDFVKKDFVGAMYQKMIQENADIVECGYNSIKPKRGSASGDDATIRLLIEQETVDIVTWNKLYKKNISKLVSFLKKVPDVKTEKEATDILNKTYQDKELSEAMEEYRWDSIGEFSGWTHISERYINGKQTRTPKIEHRLYTISKPFLSANLV